MGKKQSALLGISALLGLALLAGCAGARHGRHGRPRWSERGLASWYGKDFHGRRTANGERYNMYAMTAAHKTLPLGTMVDVTDRRTGRRVRVRINDRGPFVAGRIIDLSYGAARRLGSAEAGVVPVLIEADLPASAYAPAPPRPSGHRRPEPEAPAAPPPLRGTFAIQLGAFRVEENARLFSERIAAPTRIVTSGDGGARWWRVRVGRYGDQAAAEEAARRLAAEGLAGFVVRED